MILAKISMRSDGVKYEMLTPDVEENGTFASFNGRTIESIKDVEFLRNVSIMVENLMVISREEQAR